MEGPTIPGFWKSPLAQSFRSCESLITRTPQDQQLPETMYLWLALSHPFVETIDLFSNLPLPPAYLGRGTRPAARPGYRDGGTEVP